MLERTAFSRERLTNYLACERRFQLRYLDLLAWPVPPPDAEKRRPLELGQRFHQILHRHFLGLPVDPNLEGEPELHLWWQRFQDQGPRLPAGRCFPELSLTVPVGQHLLTGRFDLIIISDDQVHIFDWKSEAQPRNESKLRKDLQTRIYLALAAESGAALNYDFKPGQFSLTYWYVNKPSASLKINYGQAWHHENWANLTDLVAEIDRQTHFSLTDDLSQCLRCLYPIICGRQTVAPDLATWEPDVPRTFLEPDQP